MNPYRTPPPDPWDGLLPDPTRKMRRLGPHDSVPWKRIRGALFEPGWRVMVMAGISVLPRRHKICLYGSDVFMRACQRAFRWAQFSRDSAAWSRG